MSSCIKKGLFESVFLSLFVQHFYHLITFNHPDSEAQDRNGKVERYIGLCKQIARSVMMQSDLYLYTLAFCPYLLQEHLSKKKEPRF